VYRFAQDDLLPDLDELRPRLQAFSNRELVAFGRAAAYLCTPEANHGRTLRETFVIQLREARSEWKRRKALRLALQDAGDG